MHSCLRKTRVDFIIDIEINKMLREFLIILLGIAVSSVAALQESKCGAADVVKTETLLETAAELLDKMRDNLEQVSANADCSCPPKPMDCDEVFNCGNNKSGIYEIWPRNRIIVKSVKVYCDMETNGGGWTVIQRRGDYRRPKDFFSKPWLDYKSGFGDPRRDFWLGNDNLYAVTNQRKYYLRIDLVDFENRTRYAFYDQFWIDNESQNYKLHVYDFSGDAGDSFAKVHDGSMFSTFDRDNDNSSDSCALKHSGGWWFNSCLASNLNGIYHDGSVKGADGVLWTTWKKNLESLKITEMKIRSAEFQTNLLDMDVEPA